VSMRMENRGGAPGGTPELYFTDPDGLLMQLQDTSYCGGGGFLGDTCPKAGTSRGAFRLTGMRVRQIVRRLLQLPAFNGLAVFTLAIGIGANAAVFSVVEGVLLKPLPYPEPDRLVALDHAAPGVNLKSAGAAPFLYFTYREDSRVFQDVALWQTDTVTVTGLAEPGERRGVLVTHRVPPLLGAPPAVGRLFTRRDDAPDSEQTVMLTGGYWRRKFGADPSAVGRRILLDGRPREIIGVLPDSFRFLDQKVSLVLPMR